jgi:hypothetical protein
LAAMVRSRCSWHCCCPPVRPGFGPGFIHGYWVAACSSSSAGTRLRRRLAHVDLRQRGCRRSYRSAGRQQKCPAASPGEIFSRTEKTHALIIVKNL